MPNDINSLAKTFLPINHLRYLNCRLRDDTSLQLNNM